MRSDIAPRNDYAIVAAAVLHEQALQGGLDAVLSCGEENDCNSNLSRGGRNQRASRYSGVAQGVVVQHRFRLLKQGNNNGDGFVRTMASHKKNEHDPARCRYIC